MLGLSLYLAGRLADAVPYLEETREWAKDNLELAYVLGNVYAQTRKPDQARGLPSRGSSASRPPPRPLTW